MRIRALLPALALALSVAPAGSEPLPVALPATSESVTFLGNVPVDVGGVGAQVRFLDSADGEKRFFLITGAQGLSVFDATVPERPVLVNRMLIPHYENEDVDLGGGVLIVSADPGFVGPLHGLYLIDISDLPNLDYAYKNPATNNRWSAPTANGAGHTTTCVKSDCSYAIVNGNASIVIVDLRNRADPKIVKTFASPVGSTHDAQVDETGLVWIVGTGGIAAYDFTDPANPVLAVPKATNQLGLHHNSWRPNASQWAPRAPGADFADSAVRPGELILVTEEAIQATCTNQGRFATLRVRDTDGLVGGAAPVVDRLATWTSELQLNNRSPVVDCSAHYFDERDGIVAIAWYQQGTRFLDVSNPRQIRQVGYFLERTADTFSAKWVGPGADGGEIVYTIDQNRGIDILRFDRSESMPTVVAPLPPDVPAPGVSFAPHPIWGAACRLG